MLSLRSNSLMPNWLRKECGRVSEFSWFADTQKFQDEVHGEIFLNRMERDIVDTPEFQRLFRISQLGFVDLVYPTANHTRGAHSIACCAISKELVHIVNENTRRVVDERRRYLAQSQTNDVLNISFSSRVLISAGALLHDISHGPFSHDIEKKTHVLNPEDPKPTKVRSHYGPYPKHDDYAVHPALFVTLLDPQRSILARVLRAYSPLFWELMQSEIGHNSEFSAFSRVVREQWLASDPEAVHALLPQLLFHLLAFEKFDDAMKGPTLSLATSFEAETRIQWGIGPAASHQILHEVWYQPYRHDIIGDTLSADLIDYLLRDMRHLGVNREGDLRLADYLVLAPTDRSPSPAEQTAEHNGKGSSRRFRCVLDLTDYKRGTPRTDIVNEMFRLMDLRFEIHEKAVFHRAVQASVAMLARSTFLLKHKIPLGALYGYSSDPRLAAATPALCGEDVFLCHLIDSSDPPESQSIAQKIAERRIYRPLMVIPGDHVKDLLTSFRLERNNYELTIRALAALVDSAYLAPFMCFMSWCIEQYLEHAFGTLDELRSFIRGICLADDQTIAAAMDLKPRRVIFWALPYKQLHKDPEIWVRLGGVKHVDEKVCKLHELLPAEEEGGPTPTDPWQSLRKRVQSGLANASSQYESLWKLFVFVSDGLYYSGALSKLLDKHPCASATALMAHQNHLEEAQALCVETLRAAWSHWDAHHPDQGLEGRCEVEHFTGLLSRIHSPGQDLKDHPPGAIAGRVSAVAVRQYVHADQRNNPLFSSPENCRDARYKFGVRGVRSKEGSAEAGKSSDVNEISEAWAAAVTHELVQGREALSQDEIQEVKERVSHLAALPSKPDVATAAHLLRSNGGALKTVWRRGPGWQSNLGSEWVAASGVLMVPVASSGQSPGLFPVEALTLKAARPAAAAKSSGVRVAMTSRPPRKREDREVFWGIMQELASGKAGERRYSTFTRWARLNSIQQFDSPEVERFLLFVRNTVTTLRLADRAYTLGDLRRWYEEFKNELPVGSLS